MPDASPLQLGNALVTVAAFAVLVNCLLGAAVSWRKLRRVRPAPVGKRLTRIEQQVLLIQATLTNGVKDAIKKQGDQIEKQGDQIERLVFLTNRLQMFQEQAQTQAPPAKS